MKKHNGSSVHDIGEMGKHVIMSIHQIFCLMELTSANRKSRNEVNKVNN